jgi:hypothetical protein
MLRAERYVVSVVRGVRQELGRSQERRIVDFSPATHGA